MCVLVDEKKVLEASAQAQTTTGCPVIIHPGRDPLAPFQIIRILQEAGGDASKTVMSHLDSKNTSKLNHQKRFDIFVNVIVFPPNKCMTRHCHVTITILVYFFSVVAHFNFCENNIQIFTNYSLTLSCL